METNKLTVYAVFGSELVKAVTEEDMEGAIYLMNVPYSVTKRDFSTLSETKAYIQGLEDSCGWMESTYIKSKNKFSKKLIKYIEEKRMCQRR